MSRDAQYEVEVACREHEQLASLIRDKIYQKVQKKRLRFAAERETLDVAENTTSMLHPSQFNIANPASPGGPQSNRKTRHLRHSRLEVEEVGLGESNKRKRKAPPDTENGSPSRAMDSDTNFLGKDMNAKLEAHSVTATKALDDLFKPPELLHNLQRAARFAVHNLSNKHRSLSRQTKKDSKPSKGKGRAYTDGNNSSSPQSSSSSDTENLTPPQANILLPVDLPPSTEDALLLLEAPLMDRTANSSYHATRSTAAAPAVSSYDADILEPGDVIGRRAGIALLGTARVPNKREDEYHRAPPLNEMERDNDRAAMALAMEQLANGVEGKAARTTRETLIRHATREKADHIAAAEALSQESSLRETLSDRS